MAYRHSMIGHQGALKNPAASKKERAFVEGLAKQATKEALAENLARLKRDVNGIGGMSLEHYKRMPKKELVTLTVIYHLHQFNLETDNYD
jgi:hypothetical protein